MLTFLIIFGLLLAGGVVAVGFLHWRGIVRFGRRRPGWGIGTMGIGAMQALAWLFFPGEPAFWQRPLIALAAAAVVGVWLTWRAAAAAR